jgi:hypothetical protein
MDFSKYKKPPGTSGKIGNGYLENSILMIKNKMPEDWK